MKNLPLGKHTIKVIAIDEDGIGSENSFFLTLGSNAILSLDDNDLANNKIVIYPNPLTSSSLNIASLTQGKQTIHVVNLNGQTLLTTTTTLANYKLNVDKLPYGIYILKITKNTIDKIGDVYKKII